MHPLDWLIIVGYLAWILYDGLRRSRGASAIDHYFLASRSLPWWAVGLSVMATQMSAITLVGTTGQGYADGARLVQLYFGLPVAMIILSVTLRAVLLPRPESSRPMSIWNDALTPGRGCSPACCS